VIGGRTGRRMFTLGFRNERDGWSGYHPEILLYSSGP
jgi:hypothetical protein